MAERLERDLRRIVRNTPWFMGALWAVRSVAPELTPFKGSSDHCEVGHLAMMVGKR